MTVTNNIEAIQTLQKMEEIYAVYSGATRMPYLVCDEESFNDQALLFEDPEQVKEFAKAYTEKNIPLMGVLVKKEQFPAFYMNLFSIGVNTVVFHGKKETHELELDHIVKIPDLEKLPEAQRPLMNVQLELSILYFLQELRRPNQKPDKELLAELEEEMAVNLLKSQYILVMELLVPENEVTEETENDKIQLSYIKDKDGNIFQPIFSDHNEFVKFYQGKEISPNRRTILVPFRELSKYLLTESKGFSLNAAGVNLILLKEQLEVIIKRFG